MLLEGKSFKSAEKQKQLLTITKEECERLIDSVNRILDLSRMEAKMMDYQFRKSKLIPVIQKTVLKLAPIAYAKEIDLELKPLCELPGVRMDDERIAQVLENLLSNGLKYTPKGGKVTIHASLHRNKKPFIQVSVADNGPGISEENLEKIFERFERIDRGRETPRGTGLGLSIAKHVIAEHGGKIWAESEAGKGSTFYFTLPVS
jgi:two-component system sensor histidine kinase GlrK